MCCGQAQPDLQFVFQCNPTRRVKVRPVCATLGKSYAVLLEDADVRERLAERIMTALKATGDPRILGSGGEFDRYLYRR